MKFTFVHIVALTVSACIFGFGSYEYYHGLKVRDARLQIRSALETANPVSDPDGTIILAHNYLTTLDAAMNPDPEAIRWALSRYELTVRRKLALGIGRVPDIELATVTEGFLSIKAKAESRLATLEADQ